MLKDHLLILLLFLIPIFLSIVCSKHHYTILEVTKGYIINKSLLQRYRSYFSILVLCLLTIKLTRSAYIILVKCILGKYIIIYFVFIRLLFILVKLIRVE